jgi:hypothetical protein
MGSILNPNSKTAREERCRNGRTIVPIENIPMPNESSLKVIWRPVPSVSKY